MPLPGMVAWFAAGCLSWATGAVVADTSGGELLDPASSAFELDPAELDPIRYSRVEDSGQGRVAADRQTEFSLTLKPQRADVLFPGDYGLGIFGQPIIDVQSGHLGRYRLQEAIPDLHDGFAYSAGFKIEHEAEAIDGTAYVSSSQLGLSYGRLGRVWYGGVDVNLEQFVDDPGGIDQSDVLSLDVTTGRRLPLTGVSAHSPLWLLTLHGNFDVQQLEDDNLDVTPDWYLNPSLFWHNPEFTFSAQVQVPMSPEQENEIAAPDYRLRAVFEKRF